MQLLQPHVPTQRIDATPHILKTNILANHMSDWPEGRTHESDFEFRNCRMWVCGLSATRPSVKARSCPTSITMGPAAPASLEDASIGRNLSLKFLEPVKNDSRHGGGGFALGCQDHGESLPVTRNLVSRPNESANGYVKHFLRQ